MLYAENLLLLLCTSCSRNPRLRTICTLYGENQLLCTSCSRNPRLRTTHYLYFVRRKPIALHFVLSQLPPSLLRTICTLYGENQLLCTSCSRNCRLRYFALSVLCTAKTNCFALRAPAIAAFATSHFVLRSSGRTFVKYPRIIVQAQNPLLFDSLFSPSIH